MVVLTAAKTLTPFIPRSSSLLGPVSQTLFDMVVLTAAKTLTPFITRSSSLLGPVSQNLFDMVVLTAAKTLTPFTSLSSSLLGPLVLLNGPQHISKSEKRILGFRGDHLFARANLFK
jgi:hypothetical protein